MALNPTAVEEIFRKYLSKTNSINKYVALHSLSIYFAELAGLSTADHQAEAQAMLYYAYLFNAFADHFLQDNFFSRAPGSQSINIWVDH